MCSCLALLTTKGCNIYSGTWRSPMAESGCIIIKEMADLKRDVQWIGFCHLEPTLETINIL